MQTYQIELTGESPMLMHADDIKWRDSVEAWLKVPENKKSTKAGDDRTPAWKWVGYCYHDGKQLGIPSDNLMTALREGGAKTPTGKKGGTFKRQTQSGIIVNELLWPIVTPKGPVDWPRVKALIDSDDYSYHESTAVSLGFELFAKSAKVGMSKHIRVRPRFETWSATGTITVFDETITEDVLNLIWEMAGTYSGIGDWRPSSPSKPGPFGRFKATVKAI